MNFYDPKNQVEKLENEISNFLSLNKSVGELAIVMVGKNEASQKFTLLKQKLCLKLGITAVIYYIEEALEDEKIASQINEIFEKPETAGGIIQLPLPRPSLKSILNLIPFNKDIDLLSSKSLDQFYSGNFTKLSPVVRATQDFMLQNRINYENQRITLIGRGDLVGRPLEWFFTSKGAKTKVVDDYKTGQKLECGILVLSAGVPNLVSGEDISTNAFVIDFGSTVVENKTIGDLNLNSQLEHLGCVSPSPGGMGPLVVRYLLKNFLGL